MQQKEAKLYKPHEFAKIVGLTKRALRYYNEQGILKPAYVNDAGHKFYTEESFFEAQRILSLRFLMFSVEEIKEIQKSHKNIKDSLILQKTMLKEKENQIQAIIQTINDMEQAIDQSSQIAWEDIFNAVKLSKYQMVHQNMMEYYDARAKEYDEIYEGKGSAASFNSRYYIEDVKNILNFTEEFGKGNIIDIACGSGYWLKIYKENCVNFTFLDQSEEMLEQCRQRAADYGILEHSVFMQEDILKYEPKDRNIYDCAIIGFLLGHFTKVQEDIFFQLLRKVLKPGSEILIIENTWNKDRAKKKNKEDIAVRQLNDGRTYKIYKRYFEEADLPNLLIHYNIKVKKKYFGKSFTAVIGEI